MEWPAYRCFLPDLTGFAGFHCVGPDLQRRDTADSLAERPLGRGFGPAVADCGYRAPLAPRLARPVSRLPARAGEANVGSTPPELDRPRVSARRLSQTRHPGYSEVVGARRYLLAGLIVGLVLIAVVAGVTPWGARARSPPPPAPTSSRPPAPWTLLRVIAAEPHPIGSPRRRRVRNFIYGRLRELALDPHVQTSEVVSARQPDVAGVVHNIVGRLPGARPVASRPAGGALRLGAHGRGRRRQRQRRGGAARDGARLALGPPPRNDVIFLFTDGEERGLLGVAGVHPRRPVGVRRRRGAQLRQPRLVVAGADVRDEPGQRPAGPRVLRPPAAPTARRSCTRCRAGSRWSATSAPSSPAASPA